MRQKRLRCGLAFFGLPYPRFNITITKSYGLATLAGGLDCPRETATCKDLDAGVYVL